MTPVEVWATTADGKAIVHITQFCLIWVCAWLPFGLPMAIRFQWFPFQSLSTQQKLTLLLPLYAIAVPVLVIWVQNHGILLADYGLVLHLDFLKAGFLGLVIGLLSFAILLAVEQVWGWITVCPVWRSNSDATVSSPVTTNLSTKLWPTVILLGLLLLALAISFVEELLFRGFLWTELRPALTGLGAAIATSGIFAILHLIWDGWAARSQLFGLTLMGLSLCVGRWVDQDQLGLAWGLHAGWVWTIASLDAFQCLEISATAPLWLVGKPGQPLTGGLTLLCLILVTMLLWLGNA